MIYKRGPIYHYDFEFEGHRYRGSTKMRNERAAQRVEDAIKLKLYERRAGIVRRKPAPRLSEIAEGFVERVRLERKPKTADLYESCLRNNLEPRFGDKRLDEITAEGISAFKQERLRQGRKGTTINRDLAVLRRILSLAMKDGLIESSPFATRRVEFLPENRCERVISFTEEKRYLAKACPLLRDVATVMLEMGLRPEEVFGLHVVNVHATAASPYVHIPHGKSANARRDVPSTARALPVLRRRVAKAKGGHLFPLRVGTGVDYRQPMRDLHKAHGRALEKSKIKPRFRIYDLRHTYGTRAIEAGMDPLTLAKLMGHADLKTTQRYVHLSKRHLVGAQEKMERFRVEREIEEAEIAARRTRQNVSAGVH
jgi:integrase